MVNWQNKLILRIWSFIGLCIFAFIFPKFNIASTGLSGLTCPDRFVTLVNPVRGRDLWSDKTLTPLVNQYKAISDRGLAATWLFQYDALTDPDLVQEVKQFSTNQEKGVFLEISRPLAENSKVPYVEDVRWSSPAIVFLSAYSRGDRKLLIDNIMEKFKTDFGYYPKSVGAWWIDSYSLDYLTGHYGITSAMIVADQKTTDQYGIWGQWWGVPYYPSRLNILVPARNLADKTNVVVTQWAQRDLTRAYGNGPLISNNSLQANDYIRQGKSTAYFSDLVTQYSDCRNKISQVTVGLETGIESVGYLKEYINQLEVLTQMGGLKIVSMSDFSKSFSKIYPGIVDGYTLGKGDQVWDLTTSLRENQSLGEKITYPLNIAFADYFIKDSSDFLQRYVQDSSVLKDSHYFPYWLVISVAVVILVAKKTNWKYALSLSIFTFFSFSLLFLSFEKYGWQVFFGIPVHRLVLTQLWLTSLPLLLYVIFKKAKFIYFLPLSFGLDFLISLVKYAQLYGFYYFGILWQKTYFIGIKISEKLLGLSFAGQNFEINRASNFLTGIPDKLLSTSVLGVLVYPLVHIAIAYLVYIVYTRLRPGFRKVMLFILILLTVGFIYNLVKLEPKSVLPILK